MRLVSVAKISCGIIEVPQTKLKKEGKSSKNVKKAKKMDFSLTISKSGLDSKVMDNFILWTGEAIFKVGKVKAIFPQI